MAVRQQLSPKELDRIAHRLQTGPFVGYPPSQDRLFIQHVKVLSVHKKLLVPRGPWHIQHHPNHLGARDAPGRDSPKTKNEWTDQHNRLIHPNWRQLLSDERIGLPTGLGFFHRYGPNITVDAAVYRFRQKQKMPEFLLIKRKDNGEWALPGGFVDGADISLEMAARREVLEETGLEHIGGTGEVIWYERRAGLRTTLHAWTENALVLLRGNKEYLLGNAPLAGDDAAEAGWFTEAAAQQTLSLLDRHRQYLRIAALRLNTHP